MKLGEQAELAQQYDRAVLEYTRALQDNPDDRDAQQGLQRTKLRAALDHYTRARRFEAAGRLDEALLELQVAAELNPGDPNVEEMLNDVRQRVRDQIAARRDGKTELEALIERSQTFEPVGFELPNVTLPSSLVMSAGSRDVYSAIAKLANLSLQFDPQFRDQPITVELRDSTLVNALDTVSNATRNFYRVTGQRTVTVIPDTPAKRTEYEELIIRTFYLSNADVKETMDLLRVVTDLRRIGPASGINAISVNDTPERVNAAGRLIAAIDKARPEVVIDVELLEFDRTRLKEYGLQIASPTSPPTGINGQADVNREGLTVADLQNLTSADVFLTNVPGLFYRLLKSDGDTRTLANTQLRTSEGLRAQARFGQEVPVPVTTFAPIATGGINQQPITSFQYRNIGVNIDIIPRTHHDDEVSLTLQIEVSNISGTGFGNLPTFGNREINTVIRLRDGETNLLAGLIRDDERRSMQGIPGLSDIPLIGRLFANNRRETQETDIVLTLTPRIVRVLDVTENDLRPFRVGRGAGGAGNPILELPIILEQPGNAPGQLPPAPAPTQQPPPPGQPEVGPILPPVQTPTPQQN